MNIIINKNDLYNMKSYYTNKAYNNEMYKNGNQYLYNRDSGLINKLKLCEQILSDVDINISSLEEYKIELESIKLCNFDPTYEDLKILIITIIKNRIDNNESRNDIIAYRDKLVLIIDRIENDIDISNKMISDYDTMILSLCGKNGVNYQDNFNIHINNITVNDMDDSPLDNTVLKAYLYYKKNNFITKIKNYENKLISMKYIISAIDNILSVITNDIYEIVYSKDKLMRMNNIIDISIIDMQTKFISIKDKIIENNDKVKRIEILKEKINLINNYILIDSVYSTIL